MTWALPGPLFRTMFASAHPGCRTYSPQSPWPRASVLTHTGVHTQANIQKHALGEQRGWRPLPGVAMSLAWAGPREKACRAGFTPPQGDWGRSSEPAEVPPTWDPLPGSRAAGGASQFSPEFRQGLVEGAGVGLPGRPQALGTWDAAPPAHARLCLCAAPVCREAALNKHACTKSAAQTCVTTGLSPARAGLVCHDGGELAPVSQPPSQAARGRRSPDPLQELQEQPFPSPWAGVEGGWGWSYHGRPSGGRVTRLPLWRRVQRDLVVQSGHVEAAVGGGQLRAALPGRGAAFPERGSSQR